MAPCIAYFRTPTVNCIEFTICGDMLWAMCMR